MVSFTVVKLGLAELSYSQQWSKSEYSSSLQLLGCCKRVLFSISFMTSWFLIPWNGLLPYDRISHTHIPELKCFLYILFFKKNSRLLTLNYLPYIQTSEWDVNFLKFIDSGAIHLIGSLHFEAIIKVYFWMKITCLRPKA